MRTCTLKFWMRSLLFGNKQTETNWSSSFPVLDSTCLTMQWPLPSVNLKYIRRSFDFSFALGCLSSHKTLREKHISIIYKGLSTFGGYMTNLKGIGQGWLASHILMKKTTILDIYVVFLIYMVFSYPVAHFIATKSLQGQ